MLTLQHITINTKDIDKSMEFYEEVFGFIKAERPDFPFLGAWYWIEPEKTMLHLQHTHLPVWGAAGTSHFNAQFPVDHIALEVSYPEKNIRFEYQRLCDFLRSARAEWDLDIKFHSFDDKKFLQIFVLDPINFVRWELNFPVHSTS